jgi:membrane protease YdiL (CAAX protease family)
MDGDRSIKGVFQLRSRYPRQVARVRIGVGIWLLLLTAILYSSGHGGQWAWLLVVVAALHFGLAYRLFRIARKDSHSRVRFQ